MMPRPVSSPFLAAIKVDPGPIPDLKPPKSEIADQLPEKTIMAGVILMAFAALLLGRAFHRRKIAPVPPPPHPATVVRRRLSEIVPNSPPGAAAAEIAHAMREYLRTAFGLGEEELTTLELSDRFGAHRLANAEMATKVKQFLHDCNALQFARAGEAPLTSLMECAWSLLDELEHHRVPSAGTPPPLSATT